MAAEASSSRAPKRTRSENDSESDTFNIVRSPELWFPTGDIIIRATSEATASPRTRTLYKVHKDILALHCTAFADIFGGPQAAFEGVSEQDEGAPVMDLTDAEEDVAAFLKALYFPTETHSHSKASNPYLNGRDWKLIPPSYHGILRLATKYVAQGIRKVIIEALLLEWPTELSEWDKLRTVQRTRIPFSSQSYPMPGTPVTLLHY
ncbi:hypothetical protein FA95DRAFT_1606490 [Auriscalpium vulgare]|uniref:Uncharacterized protein n=1 Tax=Auriscalpium vulgare TaxID=40419 RepID=A0ACB8RTM8_9AGAM|nr:hypothetical protein FA95DRAFT_1606490 [Auriscalpium vulgare]